MNVEVLQNRFKGRLLEVRRINAPGIGFWYNGYIDGKEAVNGGGKDYTPNEVIDMLKKIVEAS